MPIAQASAFSSDPFARSDSSSLWCVETHPPYWTSLSGARGVLHHDGSPARLLWGLASAPHEEHPWDSGEERGEAGVWRASLCASARAGWGDGGALVRLCVGWRAALALTERGQREGYAPRAAGVRRVVLRIDRQRVGPRAQDLTGTRPSCIVRRHVFSAMRCIQAEEGCCSTERRCPSAVKRQK